MINNLPDKLGDASLEALENVGRSEHVLTTCILLCHLLMDMQGTVLLLVGMGSYLGFFFSVLNEGNVF